MKWLEDLCFEAAHWLDRAGVALYKRRVAERRKRWAMRTGRAVKPRRQHGW